MAETKNAETKNVKKKNTTTNKSVKKKETTTEKNKKYTKNNSSKTTTKKNTTNASNKTKSTKTTKPAKSTTTSTKKTQPKKKVNNKQNSQNKPTPKKVVNKKKSTPQKKVQVKELSKEEQLEKTLIFDGRQNQNLVEVVEKLEESNVVLEDKVIKRSKVKKVIIIILTILIFGIIAATTYYTINNETIRRESNQTLNSNIYKKVARNYKTISEINKQEKKDKKNDTAADTIEEIDYSNIKTISLTDFERKILEKENMTVLVASSTCYPCLTFEPIINEVYQEKEATIYRINISMLSADEVNRFRTYYAFKVTPTIFSIKDGIATSESTGVLSKEELISWIDKNA